MKRFLFWIIDCWRVVMDNRYNPLKYIPDPSLQAYLTLVLFAMWSFFFGFIAIFYMGWLGYDIVTSIVVHISILIPIIFTNLTFEEARKNGASWYIKERERQHKERLFPRKKNIVTWDMDKEA